MGSDRCADDQLTLWSETRFDRHFRTGAKICYANAVDVVLSLLMMAVCVYLLAVVTETIFIESLEAIAEKLSLSPSVAGASLMAMGSSAPELAIALIALFKGGGANSDLGIGTIVGSAVFNILVITGASALVRPALIDFRVIMRDGLMYLSSIGLLVFAFRDGTIELAEAIVFLVLYVVYIAILIFWKDTPKDAEEEEDKDEDLESEHPHPVLTIVPKLLRLLMGDPRKNYVRSFVLSIILIGALCHLLVDAALSFSAALAIPPVLVGLTLLAAATSVPDLIASLLVARQGKGAMAVANAFGSNVFDILICLGVPWVIAILALGREVVVDTEGIWSSAMTLVGTVLLLVFLLFTGRRLSRKEGGVLILAYVAYVAWMVVHNT